MREQKGFRLYEIDRDRFDLPAGGKVELAVRKRPPRPVETSPPANFGQRDVREQMISVGAELKKRNPGFDYQNPSVWSRTTQGNEVNGVALVVDRIVLKDLEPLKAFPHLFQVSITSDSLVNLSGLRGLPLTYLNLQFLPQIDLAACGTIPSLKTCNLIGIASLDLKQLASFPGLTNLSLTQSAIPDLTSLKTSLPKLQKLDLSDTAVSNLHPLAGMKLATLNIKHCPEIKELSVLEKLSELTDLECDFRPIFAEAVKKHPNLKRINGEFREDFLKGNP